MEDLMMRYRNKAVYAFIALMLFLPTIHVWGAADSNETDAERAGVQKVEVKVDATETEGLFNRKLFSVTGYAQLDQYGSDLAKESLQKLQLAGTQARIETMMDQAFPEKEVFDPDHMFRFVDNTGDAYYRKITESGMEPVLLLAYNMPWLADNGQTNDPPSDPQTWAESATKIIEHYNGSGGNYKLNVKYVEIWNEPNLTQFWSTGEWKRYFDLFNVVADMIHRRFPGVMVGGPAFSPGDRPTEFGKAFIDSCGQQMDFFVYHSYGDSIEKIDQDLKMWEEYIGKQAGKTPKLMVTESENFVRGQPKIDYMLQRQFTLLQHADTIIGYHQFTLMEYQEGWYTFGLINQDGSVIGENYWPYWLFRDARGKRIQSDVEVKGASDGNSLNPSQAATISEDGKQINLVYYSGPSGNPIGYDTRFTFELPKADKDRIVTVSQVGPQNKGIVDSLLISGNKKSFEYRMNVKPHEGIAITVKERNGNETPWVQLDVSRNQVPVKQTFEANVSILNTTGEPISGLLGLGNLPENWHVRVMDGSTAITELPPGKKASVHYSVSVNEPTDGWLPIYSQFTSVSPAVPEKSIPVRIKAVWPVVMDSTPDFTYMAPKESVALTIKVTNTMSVAVQGTVALQVPSGFKASEPQSYDLQSGKAGSFQFNVTAQDGIPEGDTQFTADVNYQGADYRSAIPVHVKNYEPLQPSIMMDLSELYNRDGFSYDSSPGNGDLDGAGNTLPADTFPAGTTMRYMGVQFRLPDVSNDLNNVVTANNQTISTTPGVYRNLALLALATNGDQSGNLILSYQDGTQESKPLQVTDWCGSAAYGEEKVIRFEHRHSPLGNIEPACGIYFTTVPVHAGKQLVSLTLPDNGSLHIVAASLVQ
jgi:hypothetical protein